MVIPVLLALHHKLAIVPRQESYGVLRLNIFVACLAVDLCHLLASDSVVAHQAAVVLVAVEFKHIDECVVGAPSNIGKIAVGGVASVEVDHLAGCHIKDSHLHLVRGAPCHGVFLGRWRGLHIHAVVNLGHCDERIIGHHRLVHAIES